jgi:hypothetical protein
VRLNVRLNQRQLEIFNAIMINKTMIAAAASLGTSQPTISRELRDMEQRIGFELFLRFGKRLTPTNQALLLARGRAPCLCGYGGNQSRCFGDTDPQRGKLSGRDHPRLCRSHYPPSGTKVVETTSNRSSFTAFPRGMVAATRNGDDRV